MAYGRDDITYHVESEEVSLPPDIAIPLALTVTEVVTNAIRHGFPAERAGAVTITLTMAGDGKTALAIHDNGIGVPDEFDPDSTKSLGMQLVCTLVRQLGGTIELLRDKGTTFMIKF
jgi:two-component sensor histidine kinase